MSAQQAQWDHLRRLADELELKIHLAGMEARDRWTALQPRLRELESSIAAAGKRASDAIDKEITSIGDALGRLRDEIARRTP